MAPAGDPAYPPEAEDLIMGYMILADGPYVFYWNGAAFTPEARHRALLTRREASEVPVHASQIDQVRFVPEGRC